MNKEDKGSGSGPGKAQREVDVLFRGNIERTNFQL